MTNWKETRSLVLSVKDAGGHVLEAGFSFRKIQVAGRGSSTVTMTQQTRYISTYVGIPNRATPH